MLSSTRFARRQIEARQRILAAIYRGVLSRARIRVQDEHLENGVVDILTTRQPLNPFGEVTITATPALPVFHWRTLKWLPRAPGWSARILISPSDGRYNPGVADLNRASAMKLVALLRTTAEDASDPSNFSADGTRTRPLGSVAGLRIAAKFYPQGHFAIEFAASSSTMTHTRIFADVTGFITQLEQVIAAGDRMVTPAIMLAP
jgi:hypothetical protein